MRRPQALAHPTEHVLPKLPKTEHVLPKLPKLVGEAPQAHRYLLYYDKSTCFTSTKVQILTQEGPQERACATAEREEVLNLLALIVQTYKYRRKSCLYCRGRRVQRRGSASRSNLLALLVQKYKC